MRRLEKQRGISEWPKTFRAESERTFKSFASDESQTESVRRFWRTSRGSAYADWKNNGAFQNGLKLFVQTRNEPASRLQAMNRKPKVSEGFGALLGGAHAQTGKTTGHFRMAQNLAGNSGRTGESFPSDRPHT